MKNDLHSDLSKGAAFGPHGRNKRPEKSAKPRHGKNAGEPLSWWEDAPESRNRVPEPKFSSQERLARAAAWRRGHPRSFAVSCAFAWRPIQLAA